MRPPPRALLLTLALLLGACHHREDLTWTPVAAGPLGEATAETLLAPRTLAHAEALVEGSAARLLGRPADFGRARPTRWSCVIELQRRDGGPVRRFHLEREASPFTWKFAFDHAGPAAQGLRGEELSQLDRIVDEVLGGQRAPADALPELRALERRLADDLGLAFEEWVENEARYDAGVGRLAGYTVLPVLPVCWPSRLHVAGPHDGEEIDLRDLLHTYAHELMHAVVAEETGSLGSALDLLIEGWPTPWRRALEEAWCQVWADLVLEELQLQGLLDQGRSRGARHPRSPLGVGAGGASERVARTHTRDRFARRMGTRMQRLAALYHQAPRDGFAAQKELLGRYGYLEASERDQKGKAGVPEAAADPEQLLTELLQVARPRVISGLLDEIPDSAALRRLVERSRGRGTLGPGQARALLRP